MSIMSRIYSLIVVPVILLLPFTAAADNLDQKADSAYMAGQYENAARLYKEVIASEGSSWELYYNLGNCHYRMGKWADAVIDYERALRLDPSNDEIKTNLALVNTKLVDKKGYEGSFISRAFEDITNIMSSNGWAWLAFILFALTVASAVLYLFFSDVMLRKIGFFGGGATLILSVIAMVFAVNANAMAKSRDQAVVKVSSSILSTSPRAPQDRSEEAMLLHEGAKVRIVDSISLPTDSLKSKWYDVMFDNDHRAWINSADVEII